MKKVSKILSGKLPYYFARFINKKAQGYLDTWAARQATSKDLEWVEKFAGKASFFHNLNSETKITLYKDSIISRYIHDGFEVEELQFLKSVLKAGDIFIDIGANIGLFSLLASNVVKSGKIISFEPTPATFQRLTENINLNKFKNIEARNIGLSNEAGELSLNVSENGHDAWNTFALDVDKKFQNRKVVPVSTLDKELTQIDKRKISLVKIDVEGWEKFVLLGGLDFFKNYSPVVMIEFTESNAFQSGYFVQENYDLLASMGYSWFRFIDGGLVEEEKRLHYPYDNLIATKDIGSLRKNLETRLRS